MVELQTDGGDSEMKDNNKERKSFTLRLNDEIYKKIGEKAAEIGVSKNAYITMIIHKALNEKMKNTS